MSRHDHFDTALLNNEPAWADAWHLWIVMLPRRSITGRLLWGRVWRRRDGGRWIYKKVVEISSEDF